MAAAIPSLILFVIFGGTGEGVQDAAMLTELKGQVGPSGLIFIIPFVLVLVSAFRGNTILTSLTWGILSGSLLLLLMGIPYTTIIDFNFAEGTISGALIDGIQGYFPLSIMLLFILAGSYIMEAAGLMDAMKDAFMKLIKGSVKRAELVIYAVTALFSVLITHNAASGITVSSFVREIGKAYDSHGYRRANLLDGIIASLAGVIPWGGHVLLTFATIGMVRESYDFIPAVTAVEIVPYILHGWALPLVMLIAVLTGWGLRFTGENGEELTKEEYQKNKLGHELEA